jgi:site-specific recombinase XerD
VLDGDEAKKLIESIDVSTIVGLRDRALIALLVYTFARVSAALHMYPSGGGRLVWIERTVMLRS